MDLHPLNIPHSCHDEIQLDQQHQLPTGPHRVRGKRRGVPPCYDPWWFRMVISFFLHPDPWWFPVVIFKGSNYMKTGTHGI